MKKFIIDNKVLVAAISFMGVFMTATSPVIVAILRTNAELKKEMLGLEERVAGNEETVAAVFRFHSRFLGEWPDIATGIQDLFKTTRVDRFLFLHAFNGDGHPEKVTAFMQMRYGEQATYDYDKFAIDDDYVDRIEYLNNGKAHRIDVSKIPDSIIKGVYENEGVKYSLWYLIQKVSEGGDRMSVYFCSISTHEDEPISDLTEVKCNILMNKIKNAFSLEE